MSKDAAQAVGIGLLLPSIGGPQLLTEVDDELLDLAGELERHVIVFAYRRACILANIKGFRLHVFLRADLSF